MRSLVIKLNSLKHLKFFKKINFYKSNVQNVFKKLKSQKIVGYGAAAKASSADKLSKFK